MVRRVLFGCLGLGLILTPGLGSDLAYARTPCEIITQDNLQSHPIYKIAFADLKLQTLEICPLTMVAGFQFYEIENSKPGNFGTCILIMNELHVLEKTADSIRLARSDPRTGIHRKVTSMAIQKRSCRTLDRDEYIDTNKVTEGNFVFIVNQLREMKHRSIIDFLRDHGAIAFIHRLETDEIDNLREEAENARQNNFSWKVSSIGLDESSHYSTTPLYVAYFQGPVRQWVMSFDLIEGKLRIFGFGWFVQ